MTTTAATFSEIASALADEMRSVSDFLDDPMTVAFGENDLTSFVSSRSAARVREMLDAYEMTAAAFDDELRRRTSERFAYGFGSVEQYVGDVR